MPSLILTASKGIIRDTPARLLPEGFASDGRHVRFEDGVCRKMPGWAKFLPTQYPERVTGLHTFTDLNGVVRLIAGTKSSLYVIEGDSSTPVGTGYAGTEDIPWTFASFGEHILASNGINEPQAILPPYTAAINIGDVPTLSGYPAVTTPKGAVIRTFQRHAFLLNNVAEAGETYPFRVQWSNIDDYTDWVPVAANEAGLIDLFESATPVVGAETIADMLAVYTRSQIHLFSYIGGTYVFHRRLAASSAGLWYRRLIASVENVHCFMSPDDFYMFDGATVTRIGEPVNRAIYNRLTSGRQNRGFAFAVPDKNEAWFLLPVDGSQWPNLAIIFNYRLNSWSLTDLDASAGDAYVPGQYPVFADDDYYIQALGNTEDADGNPQTGYVDTVEFGLEQGRISLQELYPAIAGSVPVEIYVGQRDNPGDDVVWSSPYTFDPTSGEMVGVRHTARHFRLRFKTSALDSPFSLERVQVNYVEAGKR